MTDPNAVRADEAEILQAINGGAIPQATVRIAYRASRAAERQADAMERIADALERLASYAAKSLEQQGGAPFAPSGLGGPSPNVLQGGAGPRNTGKKADAT